MAKDHPPKCHRASPGVRREALINATLACLRKYGHHGVSTRRIAAEADVSAGLITHHFPSISALVAAAYEALAMSLLRSIRQHEREVGATPRERLRRFFEACFAPALIGPGLFNTWLVFWSMVAHDAAVRAVQHRTRVAYRQVLESLLGQLRSTDGMPGFRLWPGQRIRLTLPDTPPRASRRPDLCDDPCTLRILDRFIDNRAPAG